MREAAVLLAVGPSGVQLIKKTEWIQQPKLEILVDFNVAPPYGIQGIEPQWKGEECEGRITFGGLGIGHMKMQVHKAAIMSLFEKERVLNAEEIYRLAKNL